jgi:hypothetical protein
MKTFEMTADVRSNLALQETQRKERSNYWEHRAGQVCFGIAVLALVLHFAGVL